MRLPLLLLTLALLTHGAMAGILGRTKRDIDDDGVDDKGATMDFKEVWNTIKDLVQRSGPIVAKTLENMPNTKPYAKYKQQLQDYLEQYKLYKAQQGPCFEKTYRLFVKFEDFIDEVTKDNANDVEKEIDKYFSESIVDIYGGDEGIRIVQEFDAVEKNKAKFDMYDQGMKILTLFMEVC